MAVVSLYITREVALRSGLFGLLGDAPVQMVDAHYPAASSYCSPGRGQRQKQYTCVVAIVGICANARIGCAEDKTRVTRVDGSVTSASKKKFPKLLFFNCGMEIVNNGNAPSQLKSVGYFEAFDQLRACLRMSVTEIPANKYSHIHFAFATVTPSFDVDISSVEDEYKKIVRMTGFKKILSFRDATKQEHRDTFVNNLVSFMSWQDLDGFDFDWEYPGALDILDIAPGSPDEGKNYLAFL
ncbi:uncharacterized protein NFIA_036270 [Aspergillus fischeri NRRL 181]|uniref:GH18 domain-containing protein n=1 Tax=Neosartorya fischeri (strain ATCC 1020 / DSM 3700 / CBS 544.65 / FGSC A1164 / JCM 1740 / NRRL 181 / WB 181) TaxID=331117 RepID=A1CZ85_NEOFI|nr:uncharacterized protein NFIA_036270 [Aspergillus fischeri NRRL 181]EAW24055.1 hypothetical protein NFIA_036270 [Aspergillus fischeri NRRL 181]